MRKIIRSGLAVGVSLVALAAGPAQAGTIDTRTWVEAGDVDADWRFFTSGGDHWAWEATDNDEPSFLLSPDDYLNVEIKGCLWVNTSSDNDFIGFTLGHQNPMVKDSSGHIDYEFLLFDWKQSDQSGAEEGFTLSKVDGTFDVSGSNDDFDIGDDYWKHQGPGVTVLDSKWDTDGSQELGWRDSKKYEFTALYTEDRVTIDIAGHQFGSGERIFDVVANSGEEFQAGKFGFYSYQQQRTKFKLESITNVDPPSQTEPVPEPGSVVLLGMGLVGAWRKRKQSH